MGGGVGSLSGGRGRMLQRGGPGTLGLRLEGGRGRPSQVGADLRICWEVGGFPRKMAGDQPLERGRVLV